MCLSGIWVPSEFTQSGVQDAVEIPSYDVIIVEVNCSKLEKKKSLLSIRIGSVNIDNVNRVLIQAQ